MTTRREEIEKELDDLQTAEDLFPSPMNRVKMSLLRKELEDAASERLVNTSRPHGSGSFRPFR